MPSSTRGPTSVPRADWMPVYTLILPALKARV